MAIYLCEECNEMIDDDYFPCVEHPTMADAFCCEECAEKVEYEVKEELKRMKRVYENEIIREERRRMK